MVQSPHSRPGGVRGYGQGLPESPVDGKAELWLGWDGC
jgi:hypothetical protein